jgi:hypothetical protein
MNSLISYCTGTIGTSTFGRRVLYSDVEFYEEDILDPRVPTNGVHYVSPTTDDPMASWLLVPKQLQEDRRKQAAAIHSSIRLATSKTLWKAEWQDGDPTKVLEQRPTWTTKMVLLSSLSRNDNVRIIDPSNWWNGIDDDWEDNDDSLNDYDLQVLTEAQEISEYDDYSEDEVFELDDIRILQEATGDDDDFGYLWNPTSSSSWFEEEEKEEDSNDSFYQDLNEEYEKESIDWKLFREGYRARLFGGIRFLGKWIQDLSEPKDDDMVFFTESEDDQGEDGIVVAEVSDDLLRLDNSSSNGTSTVSIDDVLLEDDGVNAEKTSEQWSNATLLAGVVEGSMKGPKRKVDEESEDAMNLGKSAAGSSDGKPPPPPPPPRPDLIQRRLLQPPPPPPPPRPTLRASRRVAQSHGGRGPLNDDDEPNSPTSRDSVRTSNQRFGKRNITPPPPPRPPTPLKTTTAIPPPPPPRPPTTLQLQEDDSSNRMSTT